MIPDDTDDIETIIHTDLILPGPNGKGVYNCIWYWVNAAQMVLAERILRQEFGLVDDWDYNPNSGRPIQGLVYEPRGPRTGTFRVHFDYIDPPCLYFRYWEEGRLIPEDFEHDLLREILERFYRDFDPKPRVTGGLQKPIIGLPWI